MVAAGRRRASAGPHPRASVSLDVVRASLRQQAGFCATLGSPFGAGFLEAAAEGDAWADLLSPWSDASATRLRDEAVGLRLLGAFHDRVLSGDAPKLAAAYPGDDRQGDPGEAWRRAAALLPAEYKALTAFVSHEPQTNEVGRSAALLGGFLHVAASTGLPLRVFELGASAGLNQVWDRFRFETDGWSWGSSGSAVVLRPRWTGPPPRLVDVTILSRAACDRRPVDLRDPPARRRLQAYVWADQRERLARLQAAIDLALAADVRVDAADALDWTKDHVAPQAGAATIVYHSVFLQYLPPPSRAALTTLIVERGAAATSSAPLAWLRMEPASEDLTGHEVRLTVWPGGEDRRMAVAHPHGAWVEWSG